MDDIFSRLLSLTSYITHRVIEFIEVLVLRDVSRLFKDSEINSYGQILTSPNFNGHKFSSLDYAYSSRDCNSSLSVCLLERDASDLDDHSFVSSGIEIVKTHYCRFMLPVLCFEFARRSAIATWRCACYRLRCIQACMQSVVFRFLRTLHGSSDDIGWLQCAPGMAPVEDGSTRFVELLHKIRYDISVGHWL